MRSTAFCPGHISGFFQICEHEDVMRTGSRGAGICITMGATSSVSMLKGSGKMEVRINGAKDPAPVTRQALARLMTNPDYDVVVETYLDLPVSQGFGMSAAGSLSSSLALCDILGLDFEQALRASHQAEVLHRAGLGDVAALSRGGITYRRREGLPPYGKIENINSELELAIAVVGPEIPTFNVLGEASLRDRINTVGGDCIHSLEKAPSLANFFRLCQEFTVRTGLITPEVENALDSIQGLGPASMVMLGNSIFASGEVAQEVKVLSDRWPAHRVGVDWEGPRITDSSS